MDASKCQNIERANARDPGPLVDCLYYNADGPKPQARPFVHIWGEEAPGKKLPSGGEGRGLTICQMTRRAPI